MPTKIERSPDILATEVFGLCYNHSRTIEDITNKIYNNQNEKNLVKVYRCCTILMSHGILVPKFINNVLKFQVDENSLKK